MTLSALLNLQRPIVVPDVETTGLDTNTARIVELAFQVHYPVADNKPPLEYRTLVNSGIPIPAETTEVHHITDAMVQGCRECGKQFRNDCGCPTFKPWPTFKQLAANLVKGFTNVDFAGKRVTYDLQIFSAEFARAGVPWTIGDARIVDADRLEALLEPRSLSHLYRKYTGLDLKDAHSALADVQGTTAVIEAQLGAQNGRLAVSLDELHALQFPGMIDLGGKFRFIDGVPCVSFGKWNGKPMKNVDTSYWDWLIKSEFSADVKHLAAEAKMGRFPERK